MRDTDSEDEGIVDDLRQTTLRLRFSLTVGKEKVVWERRGYRGQMPSQEMSNNPGAVAMGGKAAFIP